MKNLFLMTIVSMFVVLEGNIYAEVQQVPINLILNEEPLLEGYKFYKIQIPELPKSNPVKFIMTTINGKSTTVNLRLDASGLLMDDQANTMIYELSSCYGFGELLEMTVKPCDRHGKLLSSSKVEAYHCFTPNPLEDFDNNGHHFYIASKDATGNFFWVWLSGFEPNEVVKFNSKSGSEMNEKSITIDENGFANFLYSPSVAGKKEGPFTLTVTNANTNLSIQHYWGIIAFTPPSKYQKLKEKYSK